MTGKDLGDYSDKWTDTNAYIEWMTERVKLIHRCLKDTGSIFLHCDWRASHRLRVMLDNVFDADNFVNEIIWCYTGPGSRQKLFSRKHDTVLWYSKSNKYCFNDMKVRTPHKRQTPSTGRGGIVSGKGTLKEIQAVALLAIERGKILEDYWTDIPSGGHISKNERIGYKTQKPEKLLDRIISCSTVKGDTVLDCFVGSGTTAVTASKLNRQFVVGDNQQRAIDVTRQRLDRLGVSYEVDSG